MNNISSKPKVRKRRPLACSDCHPVVWTAQPWVVLNHSLGSQTFKTWEEAMEYARLRPIMMNGYDDYHEENVWRAKHGMELL